MSKFFKDKKETEWARINKVQINNQKQEDKRKAVEREIIKKENKLSKLLGGKRAKELEEELKELKQKKLMIGCL